MDGLSAAPTAVAVQDVRKTFRLPHRKYSTFKERALHPFSSSTYDELHAVNGVSFSAAQGEFFGIVGRNGSGKSTLLKCLAEIYQPDAGSITIDGRLSPFIELGVGFNADLTARDNVIINAVMLGLSRREARRRFDDIIAFAGARGVHRPQAQELLVRDERPAGVLGRGPGRRRRAAGRRGARRRRRGVPAEVLRAVQAPQGRRQDDHLRHARHGRGRAVLRPRDAARSRCDREARRAARDRARLQRAQLRTAGARRRRERPLRRPGRVRDRGRVVRERRRARARDRAGAAARDRAAGAVPRGARRTDLRRRAAQRGRAHRLQHGDELAGGGDRQLRRRRRRPRPDRAGDLVRSRATTSSPRRSRGPARAPTPWTCGRTSCRCSCTARAATGGIVDVPHTFTVERA